MVGKEEEFDTPVNMAILILLGIDEDHSNDMSTAKFRIRLENLGRRETTIFFNNREEPLFSVRPLNITIVLAFEKKTKL